MKLWTFKVSNTCSIHTAGAAGVVYTSLHLLLVLHLFTAHACTVTTIGAASAMTMWMLVDLANAREMSAMSICCGAVTGLIAVTPGAGFVTVGAGRLHHELWQHAAPTVFLALQEEQMLFQEPICACRVTHPLPTFVPTCLCYAGGGMCTGVIVAAICNPVMHWMGTKRDTVNDTLDVFSFHGKRAA